VFFEGSSKYPLNSYYLLFINKYTSFFDLHNRFFAFPSNPLIINEKHFCFSDFAGQKWAHGQVCVFKLHAGVCALQPEGLPEISRGSERSVDPRKSEKRIRTPAGVPELRPVFLFAGTPAGVRFS